MHAVVPHRDTVANADGSELNRRASGEAYARLDRLGNLIQMKMSRNDLVPRVCNTDQGTTEFLIRIPHRFE